MSKILIILSILFSTVINAQFADSVYYVESYRDSIKMEVYYNPSVCQCQNLSYKNLVQKKICSRHYDYDFMTKTEKLDFKLQVLRCTDPSICDCAHADMSDYALLKSCDQKFFNKNSSSEKRHEFLGELQKCLEYEYKLELTICDCVNNSNEKLQKLCNQFYFDNENLYYDQDSLENVLKNCALGNPLKQNQIYGCECAGELTDYQKTLCHDYLKTEIPDSVYRQFKLDSTYCENAMVYSTYLDFLESDQYHSSDLCYCYGEEPVPNYDTEFCADALDFSLMKQNELEAIQFLLKNCDAHELMTPCECENSKDPEVLRNCLKYYSSLSTKEKESFDEKIKYCNNRNYEIIYDHD